MGYGQCLVRRNSGIYVVRICVPAGLHDRIGKREIRVSTKQCDRPKALLVAAGILHAWRNAFQELQKLEILRAVEGGHAFVGTGQIELAVAAKTLGTLPKTLLQALSDAKGGVELLVFANGWDGWLVPDDVVVDRDDMGAYDLGHAKEQGAACQVHGLIRLRHPEFHAAELVATGKTTPVKAVWPGHSGQLFLHDRTAPEVTLDSVLVRNQDVERHRMAMIATTSKENIEHLRALEIAKTTAIRTPTKVKPHFETRFSALIDLYIKEKSVHHGGKNQKPWKPDQALRVAQKLRCFPEFMGDKTAGEFDEMPAHEQRGIIDKYWEQLKALPTGPGLSKARNATKDGGGPRTSCLGQGKWRRTNV